MNDRAEPVGGGSPEPALPMLLTVDEVAQILRTTRKAVYAMHARGQLPGAMRRGNKLLVLRDDLLGWIRESCASSQPRTARGKR